MDFPESGKEKTMEEKLCLWSGSRYSNGSQVCEEKKCYVCKDGSWEERFIDRVFGVGP